MRPLYGKKEEVRGIKQPAAENSKMWRPACKDSGRGNEAKA
jgi:hypothetical protein